MEHKHSSNNKIKQPIKNKSTAKPFIQSHEKNKIKITRDVLSIPLTYAYKPQQLNHTLLQNPHLYSAFFDKFTEESSIRNLYLKPIMQHFKEWRKYIRAQLIKAFEIVLAAHDIHAQDLQAKSVKIIGQIKSINQSLKFGLKLLLKKIVKSELRQLYDSFQYTQQYIIKMISLLENIYLFSNEVKFLLSSQGVDIFNQINKIKMKYQDIINQTINYSASHLQNVFFNKLEYKIKIKFDIILKQILEVSKQVDKMNNIKQKLQKFIDQQNQINIDLQKLNKILDIFIEIDNQLLENSSELAYNYSKYYQKIQRIKSQIRTSQNEYLIKFIQPIKIALNQQYKVINKISILHLLKNKGEEYKSLKKKLILLTKIYKYRDNTKVFFTQCSQCIKKISAPLQQIQQIQQNLFQKLKSQKKSIQYLQNIAKLVEKYQEEKQIVQKNLQQKFNIIREPNQQIQTDSFILNKLIEIIFYSEEVAPNLQIFTILPIPQQQSNNSSLNSLNNYYKKIKSINSRFIAKQLQIIITNKLNQYQQYISKQLIELLVGNLYNNQFIRGFRIIQNINQLNKKCQKQMQLTEKNPNVIQEYINKLINIYKKKLTKIQSLKKGIILKSYIQRLLCEHLLGFCNLQNCWRIIDNPINKYHSNSNLYQNQDFLFSYKLVQGNKVKISELAKKLTIIQRNINEWSSDKNLIKTLQCLIKQLEDFIEHQSLYEQFQHSKNTNSCYPSITFFYEWAILHFRYYLLKDNTINKHQLDEIFQLKIQIINYHKQKLESMINKEINRVYVDKSFIKEIKKYLNIVKSIQNCNNQNYFDWINQLMNYLRQIQMFHIGLFTQRQEPIIFIPWQTNFILKEIQKLFNLKSGTIEGMETFQPFNPDKIIKSFLSNQSLLGIFPMKKSQNNQINQTIVQKLDNQQISQTIKAQNNNQSIKQNFIYYKIKGIYNINSLSLFNNFNANERQYIIEYMDIKVIANCFDTSSSYQQIINHFNTIIKQCSKNSIRNLFNMSDSYTELQKQMKDIVNKCINSKKQCQDQKYKIIHKDILKFIQKVGLKYQIIYQNNKQDLIVLVENKLVDKYYCKVILKQTSIQKLNSKKFGITKLIQLILKLFWSDMIVSKEQINQQINIINRQLKQHTNQIIANLMKYKNYPIMNIKQVDQLIKTYLQKLYGKDNTQQRQLFQLNEYNTIKSINSLFSNINKLKLFKFYSVKIQKQQQIAYLSNTIEERNQFILKSQKFSENLKKKFIQQFSNEENIFLNIKYFDKICNKLRQQFIKLTSNQIFEYMFIYYSKQKQKISIKKNLLKQVQEVEKFITFLNLQIPYNIVELKQQLKTQIQILIMINEYNQNNQLFAIENNHFGNIEINKNQFKDKNKKNKKFKKVNHDFINLIHLKLIDYNISHFLITTQKDVNIMIISNNNLDLIFQYLQIFKDQNNLKKIKQQIQVRKINQITNKIIIKKLYIYLEITIKKQQQNLFEEKLKQYSIVVERYQYNTKPIAPISQIQFDNKKSDDYQIFQFSKIINKLQDQKGKFINNKIILQIKCQYPKQQFKLQILKNHYNLFQCYISQYNYYDKIEIEQISKIINKQLHFDKEISNSESLVSIHNDINTNEDELQISYLLTEAWTPNNNKFDQKNKECSQSDLSISIVLSQTQTYHRKTILENTNLSFVNVKKMINNLNSKK